MCQWDTPLQPLLAKLDSLPLSAMTKPNRNGNEGDEVWLHNNCIEMTFFHLGVGGLFVIVVFSDHIQLVWKREKRNADCW